MVISQMYYAEVIFLYKDAPHVVHLSSNDWLNYINQRLVNADWLLSSCPYSQIFIFFIWAIYHEKPVSL